MAKTHVSRAMSKLRARDRAQLVVMGVRGRVGAARLARLTCAGYGSP
jgi:DNA-binding NarL/FixJ family response regulator